MIVCLQVAEGLDLGGEILEDDLHGWPDWTGESAGDYLSGRPGTGGS